MNQSTRHRWQSIGIVVLAMLLLVQSVAATFLTDDFAQGVPALATEKATMPCENGGDGDCCDDDVPTDTPCREMTDCGSGDCYLRSLVSLPPLSLFEPLTVLPAASLPADARTWLLTRHDAPLMRPPISA